MKKIIIALTIIGLSYSCAEAQTQTKTAAETKTCKCHTAKKKVKAKNGAIAHRHTASKTTTKAGDTYQVCREVGGHYECCKHKTEVVTTTTK